MEQTFTCLYCGYNPATELLVIEPARIPICKECGGIQQRDAREKKLPFQTRPIDAIVQAEAVDEEELRKAEEDVVQERRRAGEVNFAHAKVREKEARLELIKAKAKLARGEASQQDVSNAEDIYHSAQQLMQQYSALVFEGFNLPDGPSKGPLTSLRKLRHRMEEQRHLVAECFMKAEKPEKRTVGGTAIAEAEGNRIREDIQEMMGRPKEELENYLRTFYLFLGLASKGLPSLEPPPPSEEDDLYS